MAARRDPDPGATAELTGALLKAVSRSFYLSVAVLPAALRPTIGLAYLLARAADTIADTRLVERRARITHLQSLAGELDADRPGRVAAIVEAAAGPQSVAAERRLLERLPEVLAAYRSLEAADRGRVRQVVATVITGMTEDLRVFPGEDAATLAALDTRAALDRYTYLVAGCVGEFWTDVHVAHRPRLAAWDPAAMRALGVRFGQGLQLVNVLRDVPRDLRQGRCYLPRAELSRLGLRPEDLLDPAAAPAARPLLLDLVRAAVEHCDRGWQYTLAIPRAEPRMRLACAWPLAIALATLERLSRSAQWLDPAVRIKVPRRQVYALMAGSVANVWSTAALERQARRLRARIAL